MKEVITERKKAVGRIWSRANATVDKYPDECGRRHRRRGRHGRARAVSGSALRFRVDCAAASARAGSCNPRRLRPLRDAVGYWYPGGCGFICTPPSRTDGRIPNAGSAQLDSGLRVDRVTPTCAVAGRSSGRRTGASEKILLQGWFCAAAARAELARLHYIWLARGRFFFSALIVISALVGLGLAQDHGAVR